MVSGEDPGNPVLENRMNNTVPLKARLFLITNIGFAEKVFSASATRRQSEAVYEYCELKPTK